MEMFACVAENTASRKAVERIGVGQKSRALSLCRHRAGRAAEVEIDLRITHIGQRVRRPDAVCGGFGQQLRHRGHACIDLGRNIAFLARGKALGCGRGDKRHKVFVNPREIFVVRAAVNRAGYPLHRGKIVAHGQTSFFSFCCLLYRGFPLSASAQERDFGRAMSANRQPNTMAAAMPPAAPVTPPVNAPSRPLSATAFATPLASE